MRFEFYAEITLFLRICFTDFDIQGSYSFVKSKFQGLFKNILMIIFSFEGRKVFEVGWAIFISFFSQGRPPHINSRFENEAANTHEGGTLGKIFKWRSNSVFTHTVVLIDVQNTFLDWFQQFWVIYYLEFQGLLSPLKDFPRLVLCKLKDFSRQAVIFKSFLLLYEPWILHGFHVENDKWDL